MQKHLGCSYSNSKRTDHAFFLDNMGPRLSELCLPYRSFKSSDLPPASFPPQQPDQRSGRHDARAQEDAAAPNCQ